LDDAAVSYCHYSNAKPEQNLIALDDLKAGIVFAMKQNLTIQFAYPNYELPADYRQAIESIDHTDIASFRSAISHDADVSVFDSFDELKSCSLIETDKKAFVLRCGKCDFFENVALLSKVLDKVSRLNIVFTDVETFTETDFDKYAGCLNELAEVVGKKYQQNRFPQLNILTDRIMMEKMNNCNAGVENITMAANGKFYICPAFYYENEADNIGDLAKGITIRSRQLFHFDHAPLCSRCDAYQCKRCVWLNRKTTREVNTPSHGQCVIAHLERNASRKLLLDLQEEKMDFPVKSIKELTYLDPFEMRDKF
jgi:CXXX repeat peptide maturase